MKVLFLDTNILLQCKHLKEIPWKDLESKVPLLLIISRPVQDEIDRLKSDGNSRRAKKARGVNKFLREIVFSEDSKTKVRSSNPSVDISILPRMRGNNTLPYILDMSSTDDQIIAEMLCYTNENSNHDVAILTQDTNLLVTAKNLNLPFYQIPDNWLLPPEPDSRDKQIKILEEHVKELQSSYPEVVITVQDNKLDMIDSLSIEVECYKELEVAELEELVEIIKAKNPIKTVFDDKITRNLAQRQSSLSKLSGITYSYKPPNQEAIDKYQKEEYPNWLKKVEDFISGWTYRLEFPTRSANFSFSVNNKGSIPVEDIVVEFKSYGGLLFNPPDYDDLIVEKESVQKLLQPPKPPHGFIIEKDNSAFAGLRKTIPDFSNTSNYPFNLRDFSLLPKTVTPRDKNTFYWKGGEPDDYTDNFAFECDEFLHHVSPERFNMSAFVPTDSKDGDKFTIQCRVAGRNLPKPIICNLHVTVRIKKLDSFDKIKSLILPHIRTIIPYQPI